MLTVLLVLQVIVTVSMIIVILIQRSSSDGTAGLAGGGNSIMSGRASANLLTRITSVLATAFIINSLVMAAMTARSNNSGKSIVDEIKIDQKTSPSAPLADAPDKEGSANEDTAPSDKKVGETIPKEEPKGAKKSKPATGVKKPAVPIAE